MLVLGTASSLMLGGGVIAAGILNEFLSGDNDDVCYEELES
jgi:hypothetical protein